MNYKEIITKVAKTFDPDKNIIVTIVNDTDMGDAHFVVADIEYIGDSDLRIPFVIYNDGNVSVIVDRLPRTVMGNF